jgi:hypothetical protein
MDDEQLIATAGNSASDSNLAVKPKGCRFESYLRSQFVFNNLQLRILTISKALWGLLWEQRVAIARIVSLIILAAA